MRGFLSLLIVIIIISFSIFEFNHKTVYTATVTDKTVKHEQDHKDTYFIYTQLSNKQERVFKDEDTIWAWKWDSSDVYGKLAIGKTYKIKAYGFRIPFLSSYENIVNVEEVKQ